MKEKDEFNFQVMLHEIDLRCASASTEELLVLYAITKARLIKRGLKVE